MFIGNVYNMLQYENISRDPSSKIHALGRQFSTTFRAAHRVGGVQSSDVEVGVAAEQEVAVFQLHNTRHGR